VIAGNTGGIPMKMPSNLSNYLVDSAEECAEKTVYLLENPVICKRLGQEGKVIIRRNFLMPRLIGDELTLIKRLVRK
jgi:hypothetical protein